MSTGIENHYLVSTGIVTKEVKLAKDKAKKGSHQKIPEMQVEIIPA